MSDEYPLSETPLQFDTAEYSASQTAVANCAVCKRPPTERYYTANTAVICEPCHGQYMAFLAGGSRFRRVLVATILGLLAGLAGAVLWYAVGKLTGKTFGIIAIVVGLMVGVAVRKGSQGRGGWFYQTLAILLTYGCICTQYMVVAVQAQLQENRANRSALERSTKNPPADNAHDKAPAKNAAAEEPTPDEAAPEPGKAFPLLKMALFLIVVFVLTLVKLPILIGMHSPISLLIIGIALYEAWKINKGPSVRIAGPFQLAGPTASGAPGG